MKKITYEPRIETFHIDFMNHVSNIVYVQWMEVGRCLLLEAVEMPVDRIATQGFGPVLVDTEISYKRQLRLGDKVRAELWMSELAKVSAWMEFRFYNGEDELVATGRQRGLFMDLVSNKPRRLGEEERERFEAFLIQDGDT